MKWSQWEDFPIDSIGDTTGVDLMFIDRTGCFSIGRNYTTKEFYSVTFNNVTHIRYLDESTRFNIFLKDITPEIADSAGLEVVAYTFAKELELDDTFIDYVIHSDNFCPEFLSQYKPIVEKIGVQNPFPGLYDLILPRLQKYNLQNNSIQKNKVAKNFLLDNSKVEIVETPYSTTQFFFLYIMETENGGFIAFQDRDQNLYFCKNLFYFQLTYKPVLSNATRAIENSIFHSPELVKSPLFRVQNTKFLKLTNELEIITNKYDTSLFSSVIRFDIVDIESDRDFVIEKFGSKSIEELLRNHLEICEIDE